MRYRIDQSDENRDWENFEINENTGEITTTTTFDRERVKTYLINVIAENVIPLALGTQEPNRGMDVAHSEDLNGNVCDISRPTICPRRLILTIQVSSLSIKVMKFFHVSEGFWR